MNKMIGALICALLFFPLLADAQKAQLTDDDIAAAIAAGAKDKNKEHGLVLEDSGMKFLNAMASPNATGPTGFSVIVYSPTTWIEQLSADAAREYKELKLEDLTDNDKAPVLRVIVNPNVPTRITGGSTAGSSSVQHVVLRGSNKKGAVQPISKDEFTTPVQNAMGAKLEYVGVRAVFPLDQLQPLRSSDKDGEFLITVVGEKGEKNFTVKKKHFEKLP